MILHGYSTLLHDCAVMQGAELPVGCTVSACKAARRPLLTGYYTEYGTEHGRAAALGGRAPCGGVQGVKWPQEQGGLTHSSSCRRSSSSCAWSRPRTGARPSVAAS